MGFHRFVLLSVLFAGLTSSAVLCPAVRAEEGELIAQDAKAQINVRSLANTEADIVAAGTVGDHVEILEHSIGNDGLIWYRVKLLKSDHSGWIRGDLIKVSGKPTAPKAAKTGAKFTAKAKPSSTPKTAGTANEGPVALKPPKPPASAKSAAPKKTATASAQPALAAKSDSPSISEPPEKSSGSTLATTSESTTIVTFETPTYAVRVFSRAGQIRLNLFNRKTQNFALDAVPVQSKSSSEGTTYSYQSDVKVTVLVPTSGKPSISASALGESLKEQPFEPSTAETPSSSPSPPTSPAPALSPTP